jgi:homoserine kinase
MMQVRVQAPATSANLGPGFDCLGLALNLHNTLTVSESDRLCIEMEDGCDCLPLDDTNLVVVAMKRAYALAGKPFPGLHLRQRNDIPLSHGLGSSAAAICCGLVAANALMGEPFDRAVLLGLATDLEGHPDNVAACLYGGLTAAVAQDGSVLCDHGQPSGRYRYLAMAPEYELATRKARAVLPDCYPKADAVFNVGHAVLMYAALEHGNDELLHRACEDRLHQNYRKTLMPGWDDVFAQAWQAGALAVFLSGAGPTILAVYDGGNESFPNDVARRFAQAALAWRVTPLQCCAEGAGIVRDRG